MSISDIPAVTESSLVKIHIFKYSLSFQETSDTHNYSWREVLINIRKLNIVNTISGESWEKLDVQYFK